MSPFPIWSNWRRFRFKCATFDLCGWCQWYTSKLYHRVIDVMANMLAFNEYWPSGVKQGCIFAIKPFNAVFASMLHDASQQNDDGNQLRYRTGGDVFNLRRFKANTIVEVSILRELIFADDYALNSNTEAGMKPWFNHFSRACDHFGFPSAPIRQNSRISLHREICTTNHTSLWINVPIISPTWEEHYQEKPKFTWKSIIDFPWPTLHLTDPGRNCGNHEESANTPSWSYTWPY